MNIKEDRFSNKSAEEIVNDVLLLHKNNTQDALSYIKNISKDDGLSLSDETKTQLKKAEDMLVNKVKRENIVEAIWPFNKKEEPKKYQARLIAFPPFKKEPTIMQLPGITSLEDPIIAQSLAIFRKKHPHSIVNLDSELGKKTFYENSIRDYKINAYDKKGNKKELCVGTLPLAINLVEKLYESNEYTKMDILKENDILTSYSGLKEGWSIKKDKKTPKDDKKDDTFLNKTVSDITNNSTIKNIATIGISNLLGTTPALTTGITDTLMNYGLNKTRSSRNHRQALEKLNQKYKIKEDNVTDQDVGFDDYIDTKKDTSNLTECFYYILSGINPVLADKRKPKLYWPKDQANKLPLSLVRPGKNNEDDGHVIDLKMAVTNKDSYLSDPKFDHSVLYPEVRFTLNGIKLANPNTPKNKELISLLNNNNAAEIKKEYFNPYEDEVILLPKYPKEFLGYSIRTGDPLYSWVNAPSDQAFTVSVAEFKYIYRSNANAEIREKLDKKYGESPETLLNMYLVTANYLDEQYPTWEKEYLDKYDLGRFDLATRGKIYLDWKNAQTATTIKSARELTKDEIDEKYYYPKIQKELDTVYKELKLPFSVDNLTKFYFEDDESKKEFKDELLTAFDESEKPSKKAAIDFLNNQGRFYIAKYLINKKFNNILYNFEQKSNESIINNPDFITIVDKATNSSTLSNGINLKIINIEALNKLGSEIKSTFDIKYDAKKIQNKQKADNDFYHGNKYDIIMDTYTSDDNNYIEPIKKIKDILPKLSNTQEYKEKFVSLIDDLEKQYGDLSQSDEAIEKINVFYKQLANDLDTARIDRKSIRGKVDMYTDKAMANEILKYLDDEDEE